MLSTRSWLQGRRGDVMRKANLRKWVKQLKQLWERESRLCRSGVLKMEIIDQSTSYIPNKKLSVFPGALP